MVDPSSLRYIKSNECLNVTILVVVNADVTFYERHWTKFVCGIVELVQQACIIFFANESTF